MHVLFICGEFTLGTLVWFVLVAGSDSFELIRFIADRVQYLTTHMMQAVGGGWEFTGLLVFVESTTWNTCLSAEAKATLFLCSVSLEGKGEPWDYSPPSSTSPFAPSQIYGFKI